MNYAAFTNDSLTLMYEAIRGALVADDDTEKQGNEPRFKVRITPDWKNHAANTGFDKETINAAATHMGRTIISLPKNDPARFANSSSAYRFPTLSTAAIIGSTELCAVQRVCFACP